MHVVKIVLQNYNVVEDVKVYIIVIKNANNVTGMLVIKTNANDESAEESKEV